MPESRNLNLLRVALENEQKSIQKCRSFVSDLNSRMQDFAMGYGPEPSISDFIKWRLTTKLTKFDKKLESEFGEL